MFCKVVEQIKDYNFTMHRKVRKDHLVKCLQTFTAELGYSHPYCTIEPAETVRAGNTPLIGPESTRGVKTTIFDFQMSTKL